MHTTHRGFTLLIAVVLASVALAIGLALLDISYKQVILATATKQSQIAFYAADAALECALYYDQQQNAFDYTTPTGGITCDALSVVSYSSPSPNGGNPRITTFSIPCTSGSLTQIRSNVTVYKASNGSTQIYTQGYNTCDTTSPRRVERGLKVTY